MCKLDSFTIYIQTSTLSVLAILYTLVVGIGALFVCSIRVCGYATLVQAIQALTSILQDAIYSFL